MKKGIEEDGNSVDDDRLREWLMNADDHEVSAALKRIFEDDEEQSDWSDVAEVKL